MKTVETFRKVLEDNPRLANIYETDFCNAMLFFLEHCNPHMSRQQLAKSIRGAMYHCPWQEKFR